MKKISVAFTLACVSGVLALLWWLLVLAPMFTAGDPHVAGAGIFQGLLVGDSLVLLAVSLIMMRRTTGTGRAFVPMWQPQSATGRESLAGYPYWLLAILLLATCLRLYRLDTDIWMDEVFTLQESVRLPLLQIFMGYTGDNQHTLLSILSNLLVNAFGESAWSMRLPATVFGIASVWAVARLARLVFGDRVALISALLVGVSYHHIWFSQNARGYTMLLFATVFSLEMLLRGLHTGRWRYWLGYAAAIAIGAWAHLTGVFIAVAHCMVILGLVVRHRQHFLSSGWQPLLALALSAWLTLHCYGLALPDIYSFYSTATGKAGWDVEWTSPLWLFSEILSRLGLQGTSAWVAMVVAAPLGLLSVVCLWRRDWVFFLLGLAPGLLTGVVMLGLGRNLWPRMFFNEAGYVVICVVVLLLALSEWLIARFLPKAQSHTAARILAWSLPVVLFLWSVASLPGLYRYPKQNYSAARDFVMAQAAEGDRILGLHMAGRVYKFYYAPQWPYVTKPEEIAVDPASTGTTWVLYTLPGFVHSAMPELDAVLRSDYEVVREFPGTLGDGEIIVVRSKHGAAAGSAPSPNP